MSGRVLHLGRKKLQQYRGGGDLLGKSSVEQDSGVLLPSVHQASGGTVLSFLWELFFLHWEKRPDLQVGMVWDLARTTGICSWYGGAVEGLELGEVDALPRPWFASASWCQLGKCWGLFLKLGWYVWGVWSS